MMGHRSNLPTPRPARMRVGARLGLALLLPLLLLPSLVLPSVLLPSPLLPGAAGAGRGQEAQEGGTRAAARVVGCSLSGTVDPGSAAYLTDCVRLAEAQGRPLLVQLDTPGGSLDSTRVVVRAFLGARVPVLVWVGPPGAHAGSAGVFLVLAAHVAGMAPGTNIGAAHPVMGPTGESPEKAVGETMAAKVENDAAAFAEAVARQRGRNAQWAVRAVRESASVAAPEAVALRVVDLVADSVPDFLAAASGRTVEVAGGAPWRLQTAGAEVDALTPSPRQRLLHLLANPAVVYLLFLVGTLGLAVELSSPGVVVPGIVGSVCLVLALVALSILPVQLGAVVLLLLGAGLVIAELFVTSGLVGAAGMVLLVLGGLLLVDRVGGGWFVEPSFGLPLRVLLPSALLIFGGVTYLAVRAAQARRRPQQAGDVGLVGERGEALSDITSTGGEAFVHGERWRAVAPRPVAPGRPVVVRRVEGLTIFVEEAPA